MLGRHRLRAGRFSMCHAIVLMLFIGVAQIIGPLASDRSLHLSDGGPGEPSMLLTGPAQVIRAAGEGAQDAPPLRAILWHAAGGDVLITLPAKLRSSVFCDKTI